THLPTLRELALANGVGSIHALFASGRTYIARSGFPCGNPRTESSKRVSLGEAVFCFELQRSGVNRPRERAIAEDWAFFPRFSQEMCTPLDSLHAGLPRPGGQDLAGLAAKLSDSLAALPPSG